MADTGNSTSVALGSIRLSTLGNVATLADERTLIDHPGTLEDEFLFDSTGSTKITDATFTTQDETQRLLFATQAKNKTLAPYVRYTRGTAGNDAELVDNCRIAETPNSLTLNELITSQYVLAPGSGSQFRYQVNGVVFDYKESFPAGVTGVTNGPAIQLGPVAAGQQITVFYGSLHDPAFTATSADALFENASDSAFTLGVQTIVTFAQLTAAGYEIVTVAGAETQEHYRLRVTAVVGAGYFPVCMAWIYNTP